MIHKFPMNQVTSMFQVARLIDRVKIYCRSPIKRVSLAFEDCKVVWIKAHYRYSICGKRFRVSGHFRKIRKRVAIYNVCSVPQVTLTKATA